MQKGLMIKVGRGAFLILFGQILMAQSSIRGMVVDENSNDPLAGATVTVHELDIGMVTDVDGNFSFEEIRSANYHLHVSYIGYKAISMPVRPIGGEILRIGLEPSSLELNEIVVESNHYKSGSKDQTLAVEIVGSIFLKKTTRGR